MNVVGSNQTKKGNKKRDHLWWSLFLLAPPAGLEPATPWLTVRCSTDWAKEEYKILRLPPYQSGARNCLQFFRHELRRNIRKSRETYSVSLGLCRLWAIFPGRRQPSIFTTAALNFRVRNGNGWTHCVKITDSSSLWPEVFFCVSVELFSRAVASQVFSPLQRLTSVFGMGTGGPTALKTLTHWYCVLLFGLYTNYTIGSELWTFLFTTPIGGSRPCRLVHLRGLEPRTHWLRVSCSTNWAKGACK